MKYLKNNFITSPEASRKAAAKAPCRRLACLFLTASLALLLTACGSKATTKQDDLKKAGIASIKAGDYKEAEESFEKALAEAGYRVTEDEEDISYYLATAQYLAGDHAEAIETLSDIVNLGRDDGKGAYLRGSIYLLEGEEKQALSDYDAAIAADEKNYDRYIAIYENLAAGGNKAAGEEYLNRGLALGGNKGSDYLFRGRIYSLLGNRTAAAKAFQKAADKGEETALLHQALLSAEDGDTEAAEKSVSAFLKEEEKPDASACLLLAEVSSALQDHEKASSYIEQGLKEEDIAAADKRGLLKLRIAELEQLSRWGEAKEAAADFLESYPGDAEVTREMTFLSTRV